MKRTILGAAVCLLSFISAAGVHRFTIPTTPTPRPDPALRWAGTTGDRPKTQPLVRTWPNDKPWYYRTNGYWEALNLSTNRTITAFPVRIIDGRPSVISEDQSWIVIDGEVTQVMSDGVLLVYDKNLEQHLIVRVQFVDTKIDGDKFCRWAHSTGKKQEYTTILGAKKTVRVYETGVPATDSVVRAALQKELNEQEQFLRGSAWDPITAETAATIAEAKRAEAAARREQAIRQFRDEQEARKMDLKDR